MIIHRLSELSRADVSIAGGKGASLGEMIQRGLPVPPGFVVSAEAYAEQARAWGLAERLGAHLDANAWQVLASIRRCWASLYGARALHYRHTRGISHLEVNLAVVVQQMVPSEAAGVLFTVDPVEQRSDRMLLSAAPGLGEAIVSGQRRGDTYRLRRALYGETAGDSGVVTIVDRDLESPGRPAFDDAQILELCPWTPLFAYAAGVVTDTGSPVSHAAIVAREYGIPAVMGAVGATERITDGQEILVDGTEGRVMLLRGGAEGPLD